MYKESISFLQKYNKTIWDCYCSQTRLIADHIAKQEPKPNCVELIIISSPRAGVVSQQLAEAMPGAQRFNLEEELEGLPGEFTQGQQVIVHGIDIQDKQIQTLLHHFGLSRYILCSSATPQQAYDFFLENLAEVSGGYQNIPPLATSFHSQTPPDDHDVAVRFMLEERLPICLNIQELLQWMRSSKSCEWEFCLQQVLKYSWSIEACMNDLTDQQKTICRYIYTESIVERLLAICGDLLRPTSLWNALLLNNVAETLKSLQFGVFSENAAMSLGELIGELLERGPAFLSDQIKAVVQNKETVQFQQFIFSFFKAVQPDCAEFRKLQNLRLQAGQNAILDVQICSPYAAISRPKGDRLPMAELFQQFCSRCLQQGPPKQPSEKRPPSHEEQTAKPVSAKGSKEGRKLAECRVPEPAWQEEKQLDFKDILALFQSVLDELAEAKTVRVVWDAIPIVEFV